MSMLTVPAHLIIDENNIRFAEVASGRACAGCQKAGCRAKTHRIPVDTALNEGPIGVDIRSLRLWVVIGKFSRVTLNGTAPRRWARTFLGLA